MNKKTATLEVVEIAKVVTDYRPKKERREMTAVQASAMTLLCGDEAKRNTGYDPVRIEVLREDRGILELLDMLETCRPGQSREEDEYVDRYIRPMATHEDDYGNVMVNIPRPDGYPNILWSTHTDTVHWHGGRQTVEVTAGVAWTPDGSCLGADDTVGNWLALEMIRAGIPGCYVFHKDEESGGGGSSWLAKHHPDWLGRFDAAIALDRANYTNVITHQGSQRCCSDAFAKSLAALLGGAFKPDDTGVFTDTANYVDVIGECTNLSVGYFRQHGPMEHTNLAFAYRLREALLAADWTKLVFERKPGEEDPDERYAYFERWDDRGRYHDKGQPYGVEKDEQWRLEEFCAEYPWVVAEFLISQGITVDDLEMFEPEEGGKL